MKKMLLVGVILGVIGAQLHIPTKIYAGIMCTYWSLDVKSIKGDEYRYKSSHASEKAWDELHKEYWNAQHKKAYYKKMFKTGK